MTELRDAVMRAATRPEIPAAVARVYADLQREIDARRPVCDASGRCCRFEAFGHRLYVTTLELAAFMAGLPANQPADVDADAGGCRFQIGGLCSVHPIRPFGCRVFFCDATSDDWQHAQYERFHGELKRLHASLGVPYQYVEWRAALRQLDPPGLPLAVGHPSQATPASPPPPTTTRAAGGRVLSLPQLRL